LPEVRACSATPKPVLTAKAPGLETYNFTCDNGNIVTVRCEVGGCRALR
jgi:hypothetical protein